MRGLVISLFSTGSAMCKMMQFSSFQKPFPKAPCCLLVDAVALETLPSLLWKLWPSASGGWKELTSVSCINPLCSPSKFYAELRLLLKAEAKLSWFPTLPPTRGNLGFKLRWGQGGMVRD